MRSAIVTTVLALLFTPAALRAQLAIVGERVHVVSGPVIENGVVLVRDGRIQAVGRQGDIQIPRGYRVLRAHTVTPGLIDARSTAGLAGIYNRDQDQDQLDRSSPVQPELRALDAYNHRELLVGWLLEHGVTTLNTGHAPRALMPGSTTLVKTALPPRGPGLLAETSALLLTLGDGARSSKGKPGTLGKQIAMVRAHMTSARTYMRKREEDADHPVDLALEATVKVLRGQLPLIASAHAERDLRTLLRLRGEFGFRLILCGASDAHLMLEEIAAAKVPVIVHPPMARTSGERRNATFELAARLHARGIPFCFQSGYESYVPKTRVVLYEAAIAVANGLPREAALEALTLGAARILGVADRVGSLDVGKDADLALYDEDPFEYTSHCVGVLVNGRLVRESKR